MSAAVWSEPPEAHPGIAATVRTDNLPARVEPSKQQVRLHLWGATDDDVKGAAQNVHHHPDYYRWEIGATLEDVARCTTIRPNDPRALAQRAGYGWAWAIYAV